MKITFQFNSRSSGQNVPAANAIAEKCNGIIEDRFYKIQFDSPEDENLKKLYELVGNLKGSQISIDNEDPVNARKFFYASNCEEKLLCKGICSHVRFGYYPIGQFLEQFGAYIESGVLSVYNEGMIQQLTNFLEPIDENKFKINKQLFLDHFQKETDMEARFCPKYEFEGIKSEVMNLPDEIQIISAEEYKVQYEPEALEKELLAFIKATLRKCEIDSTLSFNDILKCSEGISLLLMSSNPIEIQNTDVLLYSYPYFNKFILVKVDFLEEGDKFEIDEADNEEEIGDIVSKEGEFFCIKNSYMELYFVVFEKDDAKAQEYYNFIKRL